ncbi:MAG: hypothetical protein PHF56_20300 [Desulfuromonadaceae bacterium]|nr:hypothetical protein [Desulfuromonadaceae bacterium]
MTTLQTKKQRKMTDAEKQADRVKRNEVHTTKRSSAMASLAAKYQNFGDDAMLDEYELCAYLGRSVQWARNRRIYGGSLPFRKIGAAVRYRLGDVKAAA